MMKVFRKPNRWWLLLILTIALATILFTLTQSNRIDVKNKVVVCIPVYGQSLALGEEASRVTDINTLTRQNHNRIVTENLDDQFGYFDNSRIKRFFKKLFHYQKRSYELSVYGMAESLVGQLGSDTIICTFPGGRGGTILAHLIKGTHPYDQFIEDIAQACRLSHENGAQSFIVPAVCFMQGESDIADYPETDYRQLLLQFKRDINHDVKTITHQADDIRIICYQPNSLSRAPRFDQHSYTSTETNIPQTFINLLLEDTLFWASGPTYPYRVAREVVHIDGVGQKAIGNLAAQTAMKIMRHQPRWIGLLPLSTQTSDSSVTIHFNVPCPPLVFDTILVRKAEHFGFSIITPSGEDIATAVLVDSTDVTVLCSSSPAGCKVRYAVNGDYMKSGNQHGPRGNLRDSQGEKISVSINEKPFPLHNWAYQFDESLKP